MRKAGLALAAVLVLAAPAAFAAPSESEQLFRDGRTAMQAGDYVTACAKFAESQAKEPAPGTLLNLGDCEEQRGHLLAAKAAYTNAASTFTSPEKQKFAASRADTVDKKIPRIVTKASKAPAGLVVRIGEKVVTVFTEELVDPGDVVLHMEAPGFKPKEQHVTARENMTLDVDLEALEPNVATPAVAAPDKHAGDRKSSGGGLRTVGLVVGGVGIAALVAGGITGLMALGSASTVKEHCDPNLACDPQGVDAASSGSTFSTVSTVTFIAGAALVAAGAVIFLVSPRSTTTTAAVLTPQSLRIVF